MDNVKNAFDVVRPCAFPGGGARWPRGASSNGACRLEDDGGTSGFTATAHPNISCIAYTCKRSKTSPLAYLGHAPTTPCKPSSPPSPEGCHIQDIQQLRPHKDLLQHESRHPLRHRSRQQSRLGPSASFLVWRMTPHNKQCHRSTAIAKFRCNFLILNI